MLTASVPAPDFQNPKAWGQTRILPLGFGVWQITVSATVIWLLQFKQLFIECLAQETVNIVHFKIHKIAPGKVAEQTGVPLPSEWQTIFPTWQPGSRVEGQVHHVPHQASGPAGWARETEGCSPHVIARSLTAFLVLGFGCF